MDSLAQIAGLKDTSMTITGTFDEATPPAVLSFRAYKITMNGRQYTGPQFVDWFVNEIMRKNSRPILRTTSARFRAGTRRNKRIARATR